MYTVRQTADGRVVGTSSLGDVDLVNERVHLGWTGYDPAVWGTSVNPECKLLLLTHAFEDCGFGRVKIQTDLINDRSQAAIAKLGAVREGVLRRHVKRADGSWRDTVVFAVTVDDWPSVKAGLQRRLG
jgi:RimJ/RimL family protein N-acetyltransferase